MSKAPIDRHIRSVITAVLLTGALLAAAVSGTSTAAPSERIDDYGSGRVSDILVHSAAMDRDIPLTLIRPADESRPRGVLYLLNGIGGGEGTGHWFAQTDIVEFTADKNLYVVVPREGEFSYYTDWQRRDPVLGINRWSTFLGEELPPVIDARYNTNGRNAIGGISASATSVLNLAIAYPGLYSAVGSYSGCAGTSDPLGQASVRAVLEGRGGIDPQNMWGPFDGPGWRANDPVVHAAELRGIPLYIATGTGWPGRFDIPRYQPDPVKLTDQILIGGGLEAVSYICTRTLVDRLTALGIPATVDIDRNGSHSWLYWQEQLHKSWPFYVAALDSSAS